jgi:hypothetical protein
MSPCRRGGTEIRYGDSCTSVTTSESPARSWLRGYHAGKTGVIPYQSPDPYGGAGRR